MRVHRPILDIPAQPLSLDKLFDEHDDRLMFLASPESHGNPNEVIDNEVFQLLKPGSERVTIVLRTDGFTYQTIATIMGITESKVKNTVYTIRKRLKGEFAY